MFIGKRELRTNTTTGEKESLAILYGGCVISQFQDGIYDNANLMHFSKPCSRVTDADVEVYIPPGGSYYYWDWYETLNP